MFKRTFSLILAGGLVLGLILSVKLNVTFATQCNCIGSAVVRVIFAHAGLGFFSILLPAAFFFIIFVSLSWYVFPLNDLIVL